MAFCECETRGELASRIREWTNRIFGVSASSFIFHEGKEFHIYENENAMYVLLSYQYRNNIIIFSVKKHPDTMGIAGEVIKLRKGQIVSDMNNSKDHNILVDLKSLLPTFVVPVMKGEAS